MKCIVSAFVIFVLQFNSHAFSFAFSDVTKDVSNYYCQGLQVSVGFESDKARLIINHYAYILERARAASGALYSGDLLSFWDKGQQATLIYSGDRSIPCKLVAQK